MHHNRLSWPARTRSASNRDLERPNTVRGAAFCDHKERVVIVAGKAVHNVAIARLVAATIRRPALPSGSTPLAFERFERHALDVTGPQHDDHGPRVPDQIHVANFAAVLRFDPRFAVLPELVRYFLEFFLHCIVHHIVFFKEGLELPLTEARKQNSQE